MYCYSGCTSIYRPLSYPFRSLSRGNFVYCHSECTSWPLSYPFRSMLLHRLYRIIKKVTMADLLSTISVYFILFRPNNNIQSLAGKLKCECKFSHGQRNLEILSDPIYRCASISARDLKG